MLIQDSIELHEIGFMHNSASRQSRREVKARLEDNKNVMFSEFVCKVLVFSACMSMIAPALSHYPVRQFLTAILLGLLNVKLCSSSMPSKLLHDFSITHENL